MKTRKRIKAHLLGALCAGLFSLGLVATADASLILTLGGLGVYDTDLDITWLQDANAGAGTPFDNGTSTTDGTMTWTNARDWAEGLTTGGGTNWRLPSMDVNGDDTIVNCSTDTELACRDNEYGHLFHQDGVTPAAPGLFTNVQSDVYWSGTALASNPSFKHVFNFNGGGQFALEGSERFAWAVHDGNIGGAAVPVPASVWLFGSALGLLGWMRRCGGYRSSGGNA